MATDRSGAGAPGTGHRVSRRRFLQASAAGAGAALAAGTGLSVGASSAEADARAGAGDARSASVFHGPHQATVLDHPAPVTVFVAFDVMSTDRAGLTDLLRTLTERYRVAVLAYLEANAASLPAIVVRETRVKLATGTKSGRSRGVG